MTNIVYYIAQIRDSKSGKILEEKELKKIKLKMANDINEFGLRHREQIELIKSSQDFMLEHQCKLISDDTICPNCGKKLRKQGIFQSDFHDVFTDHRVNIARLTCSCGWKNKFTINSLYGNASHPELVRLQAETGSNHSFEKTSSILNANSAQIRKINNNVTVMRNVSKVGKLLDTLKKSSQWCISEVSCAELILTTDGGHIQYQEEDKHSFEALISTVYKPTDVITISKDMRKIKKKVSVGSAKNDRQGSIKKLTLNACKKLGMTNSTLLTALTDGANNCWSIVNSLEKKCQHITKILDWFHIGKKFKERENKIPSELIEIYHKAKWHCWHGHPETSITRLNQIIKQLSEQPTIESINQLIRYIKNNSFAIVNYHARRLNNLPYTSQLAETSVNTIINDRQKHKKMQWTRSGAHNILQIRTSLFSKTWHDDWNNIETQLYKKAA